MPWGIGNFNMIILMQCSAVGQVYGSPLRRKSDAPTFLRHLIANIKLQHKIEVKELQFDSAGELTEGDMKSWASELGIDIHATPPYCHETNGKPERLNRTIKGMLRASLKHGNIPSFLWPKVLPTLIDAKNDLLHRGTGSIPSLDITKRPPNYTRYHPIGCRVWAYIDEGLRKGLDDTAEPGVYLGPEPRFGHRVWFPHRQQVLIRDILKFEHDEFPLRKDKTSDGGSQFTETNTSESATNTQRHVPSPRTTYAPVEEADEQPPRRSERIRRLRNNPVISINMALLLAITTLFEPEPTSVRQAFESPEAEQWISATEEELRSLWERGSFEEVDLPNGHRALPSKMVYKRKLAEDNSISRYKARLVACGNRQASDTYDEVFAPTARWNSLLTIVALASAHGIALYSADIDLAYLNAELHEDIFIRPPAGFRNGQKVWKVKRCLYGLRNSAAEWNKVFNAHLLTLGFKRLRSDPCLYFRHEPGGHYSIAAIYVDDILYGSTRTYVREGILASIARRFKTKDLGEVSFLLGCSISRLADGGYFVSQRTYIERVLLKYDQERNLRQHRTPMQSGVRLFPATNEDELADCTEYASLVGALLWIGHSRPDASFALSQLTRFMSNPTTVHYDTALYLLGYFKLTKNYGIHYPATPRPGMVNLCCVADAEYAGDETDSKSVGGHAILINGSPVAWSSKKQPRCASSSNEAEYMNAKLAGQEVIHFRQLLQECGIEMKGPTNLWLDSTGAIATAKEYRNAKRSRHFRIDAHVLRDWVAHGEIMPKFVRGSENPADLFTKNLGHHLFRKHVLTLKITDSTS